MAGRKVHVEPKISGLAGQERTTNNVVVARDDTAVGGPVADVDGSDLQAAGGQDGDARTV